MANSPINSNTAKSKAAFNLSKHVKTFLALRKLCFLPQGPLVNLKGFGQF